MRNTLGLAAAFGIAALAGGCAQWHRHAATSSHVRGDDLAPVRALGPAQAAEPIELTDESDLGSYLAYAAANDPGLEAAFHRWKAALERVPQVESLPDPRLSYRYYVSEVETRVGAMRQGVGLSQTFPWLGTLELRGDAATQAAKAARHRFEAARLKLFHEVTRAYTEYYHLGRRIAVVRENLALVRQMEQVARARYRAAAASHPSVVRAQVELGKLEDRLRSLEDLRGPMMADLDAAMDRPPEAELPWPASVPREAVSLTDADVLGRMARSNPELLAMDAETEAARRRVDLARKAYYPDVTLGVDYVDVTDRTGPAPPGDSGQDALAVMASVNLPIWYDKLAAGVREARNRVWAASLTRSRRSNELAAKLKLALYRFRDAGRKLDLYRNTLIPKGTEALKTSTAAFRAGEVGFTDVIDAQRTLLEFELAAERAVADRARRLAELEMLVGEDLTGTTPRPAPDDPPPDEERQP